MLATELLKRAALGTLLFCSGAQGQTQGFCEGELGEADWDCGSVATLPAQVGDRVQKYRSHPRDVAAAVNCRLRRAHIHTV